jgi:2-succinyl-5-enolpyruvyl-6-hydroxy-3-cyclohexene-1-carboxylate synthase
VARHLTRVLPPGAALVTSSSMPVRDVEWFGTARSDVRHLANRGANGIDGVVSTAVGVAAAGVRTTLLIGDVAFLHDSNGLLGLADRRLDLTVVVLDNDGGGIFSFLPQRSQLPHERFESLFGTPHGLDLVALARAHGVDAEPVESLEQLAWRPGTRVLVVPGDRDDNVELHRRLDAAVAAALLA